MQALHDTGLGEFIRAESFAGKPVVGICLGMQLLADSSTETRLTPGLGLIPGKVGELENAGWHIGWNTIEVVTRDPIFAVGDGKEVYFNHSYMFHAPVEYQAAVARLDDLGRVFTVAVRRHNVVGLQFHPEKSQASGRQLLASVIEGLIHG
jgi:glutamine amidotransferase